jgi:hypothetical protein
MTGGGILFVICDLSFVICHFRNANHPMVMGCVNDKWQMSKADRIKDALCVHPLIGDAYFMSDQPAIRIRSYSIDDGPNKTNEGAVEITMVLEDGRKRWCFFFTPQGLATCGDFVDRTQIRIHLGVPWMIVVSELNDEIIDRVLRQLERDGEIEAHTMPID